MIVFKSQNMILKNKNKIEFLKFTNENERSIQYTIRIAKNRYH